jgi:hypothetical protein
MARDSSVCIALGILTAAMRAVASLAAGLYRQDRAGGYIVIIPVCAV